MKAPLLALISSSAITLGLLLVALVAWLRARRFVASATRTTGTVIELRRVARSGRAAYAPVVRFATQQGAASEFSDYWASNPPRFSVGQQVPVLYDPLDPSRARIYSRASDLFYLPMLLGGLGGFFAALLCALAALMVVLGRALGQSLLW